MESWCYDTDAKEWKAGEVIDVFHHAPEEMADYYLIINDDLRVTPNHPFYVNGEWISAGELQIGDPFGDGISSIERVYERVPTYNFEVDIYHNYKVVWDDDEGLVHNMGADDSDSVSVAGTKFGGSDESNSNPIPIIPTSIEPVSTSRPLDVSAGSNQVTFFSSGSNSVETQGTSARAPIPIVTSQPLNTATTESPTNVDTGSTQDASVVVPSNIAPSTVEISSTDAASTPDIVSTSQPDVVSSSETNSASSADAASTPDDSASSSQSNIVVSSKN